MGGGDSEAGLPEVAADDRPGQGRRVGRGPGLALGQGPVRVVQGQAVVDLAGVDVVVEPVRVPGW